MPPIIEDVEDENYASSDDEDFVPDAAPAAASASASEGSESEADEAPDVKKAKPAKRKRAKPEGEEAEDAGFENSGDEAIIGKGLKKQRRRRRRGEEEEDEGGEGGFVKTRRMAAQAEEERAPLADTKNATVDVDALWASMMSGALTKPPAEPVTIQSSDSQALEPAALVSKTAAVAASNLTTISNPKPAADDDDTVTIHRTYNFAGKVHTETKVVPRDSAEARLYLASNPPDAPAQTSTSPPRRPTKLARRSIFEPVTEPLPQRADLKLGVGTIRERLVVQGKEDKGRKLNTVEKSKMDWAGFVDKEGIREELEVAEKAKGSYLQRKEFLDRVEGKREEEARRARMKGLAA